MTALALYWQPSAPSSDASQGLSLGFPTLYRNTFGLPSLGLFSGNNREHVYALLSERGGLEE